MKEYTKDAIIRGAVVALAGLAIFFGIIAFSTAKWWVIPIPALALGYGAFSFVKKYYKED